MTKAKQSAKIEKEETLPWYSNLNIDDKNIMPLLEEVPQSQLEEYRKANADNVSMNEKLTALTLVEHFGRESGSVLCIGVIQLEVDHPEFAYLR